MLWPAFPATCDTFAQAEAQAFTVGTPLATANSTGVNRMFENIFGIHEQALQLHGQRVGILATNLANADTPNYKARDIDFSAVLSKSDATPLPLNVTHAAHITIHNSPPPPTHLNSL